MHSHQRTIRWNSCQATPHRLKTRLSSVDGLYTGLELMLFAECAPGGLLAGGQHQNELRRWQYRQKAFNRVLQNGLVAQQ